MVNQSVIDSSVDLEQLKDIEDLIPDMDKAISEKWKLFWINLAINRMLT